VLGLLVFAQTCLDLGIVDQYILGGVLRWKVKKKRGLLRSSLKMSFAFW